MKFLIDDEDVGFVELDLKADKSFSLKVEILVTAQIEIEGDINNEIEGVDENYSGKWTLVDDKIILTFNGQPFLQNLFNPKLDPKQTTNIIDNTKVAFDKDNQSITIRGAYCERM